MKVIVIGLDGLDPGIVEQMLLNDELPHLANLKVRGGNQRLKKHFPGTDTGGMVYIFNRY